MKYKNDKQNIILIGMPGAGKSTVGVVLAKKLGKKFMDTDLVIQEKTGLVLEDIIRKDGIDGFIDLENKINSEIDTVDTVIATGGSLCYCKDAMLNFSKIGTVVYLKLDFDSIVERLGDFSERGVALRKNQTLRDLYDERIILYESYSDFTVDCEGLSLKEAIDKVANI